MKRVANEKGHLLIFGPSALVPVVCSRIRNDSLSLVPPKVVFEADGRRVGFEAHACHMDRSDWLKPNDCA